MHQNTFKGNNIDQVYAKSIVNGLFEINARISDVVGKEYQIGYSYFMIKHLDPPKLLRILKYAIIPLIEQYFFGRKETIKEMYSNSCTAA